MNENIYPLLRTNYVRRFAANAELAHVGDTNGHHQAMVAQILLALHPKPSLRLIYAALHHDAGEEGVGDLAGPAKAASPNLAALLELVEEKKRETLGIKIEIDGTEAEWLKFADHLAAYMHVRIVSPMMLMRVEWRRLGEDLYHRAVELGCRDAVSVALRA